MFWACSLSFAFSRSLLLFHARILLLSPTSNSLLPQTLSLYVCLLPCSRFTRVCSRFTILQDEPLRLQQLHCPRNRNVCVEDALVDQVTVMRCNTLQYTLLQHTALQHTDQVTVIHCNTLQYTLRCNTLLQHTALQHTDQVTVIRCNTLQYTLRCNTLQYTASRCTTLVRQVPVTHCNATHCNTLQLTASQCNTLVHQGTATHCNSL